VLTFLANTPVVYRVGGGGIKKHNQKRHNTKKNVSGLFITPEDRYLDKTSQAGIKTFLQIKHPQIFHFLEETLPLQPAGYLPSLLHRLILQMKAGI
jgi:hypothetical protein